VDDYLELRRAATRAQPPGASARAGGDSRSARKELNRIERRLARIAVDERALHDEMAAHAADYEKVAALAERLRALAVERSQLEDAWLATADEAS
jgi:ATP-binding cassette subfamily F protein uup